MENQNERSQESLDLQDYIKSKQAEQTKVVTQQAELRKSFI